HREREQPGRAGPEEERLPRRPARSHHRRAEGRRRDRRRPGTRRDRRPHRRRPARHGLPRLWTSPDRRPAAVRPPARRPALRPLTEASRIHNPRRLPSPPMRVLVVEDEPDLRDALLRGLRREGYAVDGAGDGPAAVARGLAPPLRGREPPPLILMVTARDAVEARVEGLDSGADDYLAKPFDFRELTA